MYRVLLVDDEPFARMGLRSTFDWEINGFQVVGEASNGKNALQWIDRNEVDILITDIAMPVMDGLELMRAARERCPWIKIVLLSCHSDFAFVREGIRMGASDYLLKPTLEPDDLKEVLDKIKQQIVEDRKINHFYLQQELSGKRAALEKAFTQLIAREETDISLTLGLPWLNEGYRIVVCLLDNAAELRSEKGGIFIEIVVEEVQESFYELARDGIAFRSDADQLILVMPEAAEGEDYFKERLGAFHSLLKQKGVSFTFGISGKITGVERLKEAVQEGRQAAKMRFYQGAGGIHSYEQVPSSATGKEETEGLKNMLKDSLTEGAREESSHYLQKLFMYWTYEHRTPSEVKREALDLLYLFQMWKKDNKAVTIGQIEALRLMVSVEQVQELISSAFEEIWRQQDEITEDQGIHRRSVAKAIEYLKSNYRRNVSLQEVADHVSMSKNYFSEVFKKNTGQNFIDYLIQLRLRCASELLRTSSLKVYEVAEMSGFNDVKYFSKVFKKIMKVSPADYREKIS